TNAEVSARYRARHPERVAVALAVWRKAHKQQCLDSHNRWRKANPKSTACSAQKSRAKARGIGFNLTLQEWIEWWGDQFILRGTNSNDLCMARIGDVGAYEIGNIKMITNAQNRAAQWVNESKI
ncbi:hypothetical protein LCGC14_2676360, partial [marine sediment metagenome]